MKPFVQPQHYSHKTLAIGGGSPAGGRNGDGHHGGHAGQTGLPADRPGLVRVHAQPACRHLVKGDLLERERPQDQIVDVGTPSFPSGHTTATVAAVVASGFIVGRLWVWMVGVCVSVLMMLSRTYPGVHWLSDTIGGWMIGAGMVTLLWIYFEDKCIPEYHQEEAEEESTGKSPLPFQKRPGRGR